MEIKKDDQSQTHEVEARKFSGLVVSRRPGQSIKIGEGIEVFLLEIDGQQARIGVRAPGLEVWRNELSEESRERIRTKKQGNFTPPQNRSSQP